jgi:hypothetical protein
VWINLPWLLMRDSAEINVDLNNSDIPSLVKPSDHQNCFQPHVTPTILHNNVTLVCVEFACITKRILTPGHYMCVWPLASNNH